MAEASQSHTTTRFGRPLIEVENLVMRFGKRTILDGISLTVRRGETVVVLGRSGTGKSVLLKTIIGLLEPTAGHVRVLGQDVHALDERHRLTFRKDIGYVFQYAALFDSLSVLQNVGFPLYQRGMPPDQIESLVRKRLDMVGLGHTLRQYPPELSGGMRKRVGLARAIIDLPPVVLYDEPTSGLDPLTTDVIDQIILRLRAQLSATSVVVTHDISSAFTIADRVVMLDQGHIVVDAPPQAVRESDNPWVQHFIHGQALESERIDTARFALPTGFATRFATTSTHRPATQAGAPLSGGHQIPPSIRLRRPGSQRRRAAGSGETPDPSGQMPTPPVEPVTAPATGEESRIGMGSLHGEDSGVLMPIDWQLAATIDLDEDDETTDGLTRRRDRNEADAPAAHDGETPPTGGQDPDPSPERTEP